MHLINTTTLELKYFIVKPPPYAILSHTWGDEEVSFQEFMNPDPDVARSKKGFGKIEQTCAQARHHKLNYAWVDTCCIDKSSSAELSEAINSMYSWYKKAQKCYVFLEDVVFTAEEADELRSLGGVTRTSICGTYDMNTREDEATFKLVKLVWSRSGKAVDSAGPRTALSACRWFTRGWTLQELIAPTTLIFYDGQWNFIGRREQLKSIVASITNIDASALSGYYGLQLFSIAARMSWASMRQTTRPEDMAYCLLGLFDVSMPILYGEGGLKAFVRLQEAIMKDSTDMSLLAWQDDPPPPEGKLERRHCREFSGVLAESPARFKHGGLIGSAKDNLQQKEIAWTNKGLRIKTVLKALADLPSRYTAHSSGNEVPILPLDCKLSIRMNDSTRELRGCGIYLCKHGPHLFKRQWPDRLCTRLLDPTESSGPSTMYLSKNSCSVDEDRTNSGSYEAIAINLKELDQLLGERQGSMVQLAPIELWDQYRSIFLTGCSSDFIGKLHFPEGLLFHHLEEDWTLNSFDITFGRWDGDYGDDDRPWLSISSLDQVAEQNPGSLGGKIVLRTLSQAEQSLFEDPACFDPWAVDVHLSNNTILPFFRVAISRRELYNVPPDGLESESFELYAYHIIFQDAREELHKSRNPEALKAPEVSSQTYSPDSSAAAAASQVDDQQGRPKCTPGRETDSTPGLMKPNVDLPPSTPPLRSRSS